jgi:hypothetical protein
MNQNINFSMQPVKSSNILAAGYDEETKAMAVQFSTGTYIYQGVERKDFDAMVNAPSVGAHHAKHVRGKFSGAPAPKEEKQAA